MKKIRLQERNMYVWIGIDVDSQLAQIKEKARAIEEKIGFENSNFTLPLHISLKISFPVDSNLFDDVKADIIRVFDESDPFEIYVEGIECHENICWIMMKRNLYLDRIHDRLNTLLLEKYGVPLHEYDMDYKFHTTLFMENNSDKIRDAYSGLYGVCIPKTLMAKKFVIGTSDSGSLGTYRVVYEHKNN